MTRSRAVAVVALGIAAAALLAVPVSGHTNHVSVDAQVTADGTVLVETAFAAEEAWLAVRADDGGDPGAVLGARRIESGFRTDVRVDLDGETENRTAWVVLHHSDGDDEFDPEEDEALEALGSIVGEQFELGVGDRPVAVTAERFRPQNASNGTVTVRRVTLPSDGHVAIHADADGPGEVVGSRALSTGTHENVTVQVNESFLAGEEPVIAWAVLHADDGDGTFDPDADPPLRVGTEVVGTTFGVRGGPATTTGTGTEAAAGTTTAATPTDDGSIVVTASPTPTPTGTATESQPTATGASGPGPGVAGALAAVVALAVATLARKRT